MSGNAHDGAGAFRQHREENRQTANRGVRRFPEATVLPMHLADATRPLHNS
jgi:hypothetical protein